jgi:hypothetical protein
MIGGSVRDAEKPITIVARRGLPNVWLRVRGSHDVQSSLFTAARQQFSDRPSNIDSHNTIGTLNIAPATVAAMVLVKRAAVRKYCGGRCAKYPQKR